MKMQKVEKIIIHCSASEFGDAELIDRWHKEKGWDGIGYHYVILNGKRKSDKFKNTYNKGEDGGVEAGRSLDVAGAHCLGENKRSIGICLIGDRHFSAKQLFLSLPFVLRELCETYGLTRDNIYVHNDFNKNKTCPNMSRDNIIQLLK